jgi:hypothetical protein
VCYDIPEAPGILCLQSLLLKFNQVMAHSCFAPAVGKGRLRPVGVVANA